MRLLALAFLAGVVSLTLLADVSVYDWSLLLLCSCLVLIAALRWVTGKRRLLLSIVIVLLLALCRAGVDARHTLDCQLAEQAAGKDVIVTGVISSIPARSQIVSKFLLVVDGYPEHGSVRDEGAVSAAAVCRPERIRVGWYHRKGAVPEILPGQRWQLLLRAKPPHGFANPGGFDFERWLFQQDIHATAYVRSSEHNRLLATASFDVDALRQRVNAGIAESMQGSRFTGLVQALATGTRHAIDRRDWQRLIATGTNHLIAISGLHIGLAAGFAYMLVCFAWRRWAPLSLLSRYPAQDVAALASLLSACLYAVLAGMAIPAQRALIMLGCFVIASLWRRHSHPYDILSIALLLVLMMAPMSVHSAGFWFSFIAVFAIVTAYRYGLSTRPRWQQFVLIQIVLSLCLLPVSLLMFQQASLVSPLANLIMVPYVSLLVVPLVLLAVLLMPLSHLLSGWLLQLVDILLQAIWPLLSWASGLEYAVWQTSVPSWMLVSMVLAVACLHYRRFSIALLVVLPAIALWLVQGDRTPPLEPGSVRLDVLDVGQGTAVVVQTQNHVLLYDTGSRFGDALDAGRAVILPFLRERHIGHIDRLIISHGDNDHIGGAASVLEAIDVDLLMGQQIAGLEHDNRVHCEAGMQWQYDAVQFEILHPPSGHGYRQSNNLSCVLRVSAAGGVALLTGDIEGKVERALLMRYPGDALQADVLLVPHHGSKTSSSEAFINAVAPRYAVITAGYRNRYRLPAAQVLARYLQRDAWPLVTGGQGAISILIDAAGVGRPRAYRADKPAYWRQPVAVPDYGQTHK